MQLSKSLNVTTNIQVDATFDSGVATTNSSTSSTSNLNQTFIVDNEPPFEYDQIFSSTLNSQQASNDSILSNNSQNVSNSKSLDVLTKSINSLSIDEKLKDQAWQLTKTQANNKNKTAYKLSSMGYS